MPRRVDAQERRRAVGEAVWRVVRRDGLEAASVRTVAVEAGLATGSLRHYFTSQADLQVFAMSLVVDRIRARVLALDLGGEARAAGERVLHQFLPLDDERRGESEVWLAFTARSLVDPALRRLRDEAYDELGATCRWVLTTFFDVAAERLDAATDRTYALLDGLLLHGVVRPATATGDVLVRTLRAHLREVAAGPGSRAATPAPPGGTPAPG